MPFQPGSTNRTALRFVSESVFGTTPTTPVFQELRYTGESLNFNQTSVVSAEIRADRNTPDMARVDAETAGDVNFEWSFQSFDELLAASLCSAFGAATLGVSEMVNGVLLKSFTFQKHFQDLAVPVFHNFNGCRIGGFTMDFQTGQILTGAFNVMGLGLSQVTTQITGATFQEPGVGNAPMNAASNLLEIKKNGVTMTAKARTMTMALTNNLRAQKAIGTLGSVGVGLGRCEITGNIELYFESAAEYADFVSDTPFALSFKLVDPEDSGNFYEFFLYACKFENGTVVSGGLDQDVMVSGSYRVIYDPTEDCMIKIVRTITP